MGDLLYEFAQWLRETPLVELAQGIASSRLSAWLVEHFWIIPSLQTLHILSLTVFFGSVLLMALRLFGRTHTALTLSETALRFIPWTRGALAGLALSGLLLIIAEPERELLNPVFWIKIALIVPAILISLVHHRSMLAHANGEAVTSAQKSRAVALLIVWCVVILCGRWIAYAPV